MKKHALISSLMLMAGCEMVVDIDIPFPQAQPTLNSFFHKDSLWVATLTLNQSILDTSPRQRIENALVIVYKDERAIDTLTHVVNGVYRSDNGKPENGNSYEIRATVEGHLPVKGRSHVPLPAMVTNVEITEGTTVEGYPESVIRINFADDPKAVNYYQIFLEVETEVIDYENGGVKIVRNRLSIESDDPIVQNRDAIDYDGLFMKDIFFNGGEGTISFKTTGSNISYHQHVIAIVRTVSEDYYNYKISRSLQQNTADNPFAQPVNVYDNIENGFGIFAGYSEDGYTLGELPLPPVITSISPQTGKVGDHVIIKGENFWDFTTYTGTVTFTGDTQMPVARIENATPTELEVIIPPNAVSGRIYVSSQGRVTASDELFVIED